MSRSHGRVEDMVFELAGLHDTALAHYVRCVRAAWCSNRRRVVVLETKIATVSLVVSVSERSRSPLVSTGGCPPLSCRHHAERATPSRLAGLGESASGHPDPGH